MSFNTRAEANTLAFKGVIPQSVADSYAHVDSATADMHYGHLLKMLSAFGVSDAVAEQNLSWPAGAVAAVRAKATTNSTTTLATVLTALSPVVVPVKPTTTPGLLNQAAEQFEALGRTFRQMASQ